MAKNDDFFEEIPEEEISGTPRGRKPSPVAVDLSQRLAALPTGRAILAPGLAVNPNASTFKVDKARNGAVIRSAAKLADLSVSIVWRADGVPQIKVTK